jgi:predicted  nucleic acid-binding Zn-ribbon protein
MGLRDWFRKSVSPDQRDDAANTEESHEGETEVEFAALQERRMKEAFTLLDAVEDIVEEERLVEAPYDASEADVASLREEGHGMDDAFTHVDEVVIEDVAALDDPYESATVEGDLPQTVKFEGDENSPSV